MSVLLQKTGGFLLPSNLSELSVFAGYAMFLFILVSDFY